MGANLKVQIETLMKGKNSFVIYLTEPVQGKFVGAIQAGNFNRDLKVIPNWDKITFSEDKTGINVTYIRKYSDFPPSVSNFRLSEVKKVEEVLSTK
jgi:hypothetical protein